jgi:hypothetical protein
MPPLATGKWVGINIPLADFTGLITRGHLAQMVLSGDLATVYVDNVYFYREQKTSPDDPAPVPTVPADDVISLFSNAYTDVTVDTWSAEWDAADVADVQIKGDDTKLYTNLVFAGIDFTSQTIDASDMTHFHMDVWTPDPTDEPATFKVKLVDFGADGAYGGGDDVEHELAFTSATTPAITTGAWAALDVPLAEFTGLTTKAHLAQMIISGDPNTVFVDNVYFYKAGATAVDDLHAATPELISLEQNYPNPFNPSTTIRYRLTESGDVTLRVYSTAGEEVATLVSGRMSAGTHDVQFDARGLASGTYMYVLTSGQTSVVKTMTLLK